MDTQDLTEAASRSDLTAARKLLKQGSDPNAFRGAGPLHLAVLAADCPMVELLLFAAADPALPDCWGMTAEDYSNGS